MGCKSCNKLVCKCWGLGKISWAILIFEPDLKCIQSSWDSQIIASQPWQFT
jgi:hypothetical protein